MIVVKGGVVPDVKNFYKSIIHLGGVYVDVLYLQNLFGYYTSASYNSKRMCVDQIGFDEGRPLNFLDKSILLDYLIRTKGISEEKFEAQGVESLSVDATKVLEPLLTSPSTSEEVKDFLKTYLEFKSHSSKVSQLEGILSRLSLTDLKTDTGNPLAFLKHKYTRKSTGRYYTENYNTQTINLEFTDCIKSMEDYYIASGDLKQVDFTVALHMYLNDGKNLEELNLNPNDRYENFYRMISKRSGTEFDLDVFLEKRDKIKAGSLSAIYAASTYTLLKGFRDKSLVKEVQDYLSDNSVYKSIKESLKKLCDLKEEFYVTTYFGTKRKFNSLSYRVFTEAINSPIQGTSFDIIMLITNNIMKESLKRNLNGKILPLLVRHDEILFLIHKDYLEHMDILKNNSSIKIDNWAPISLDFKIGNVYGRENPEIMKQYNSLTDDKNYLLEGPERKHTFIPTTSYSYIEILRTPDINLLGVYDENHNSVYFRYIPTNVVLNPYNLTILLETFINGMNEKFNTEVFHFYMVNEPISKLRLNEVKPFNRFLQFNFDVYSRNLALSHNLKQIANEFYSSRKLPVSEEYIYHPELIKGFNTIFCK